ncbi:isocitrate lyase/phosphoenolpyruvate mutase family protein [Amycolatopsis thermalba]|uniref:Isocitrate lyase/phosphoenolpyruvate mutase family protein n=1 Tax=Amycolatopsis thermalba TaxID=944492 RepID=A0ABY4P075_9PSEU|nr:MULTISPECIES: isocitrate lyase/phosphoenolpyruvate mutase family protein [Amycolatopsis]OXM65162.1 phosphonomutase [Amycolatopsis sp. KNN50.9b]UQS25636.1 isocitrate lyase/phosphoenolpyruvate mutase family protein [Amycolatopsis thermalba]
MSFAELHHTGKPLLLPNAWDHASAAVLVAEGFPAIGTTSLGVAAAAGLPDGTGATRDETVALARRLTRLPCYLTVDIEGGFADDPAEVAALGAELAALGVAGVNIEDGRDNGRLADPAHQQELIAALKAAAPGLFVNARTDTHWLATGEDPVARVRAYQEAGADGVFVPGLPDETSIAAVVAAADVPVNVLFSPSGPPLDRLGELGVRRISCGSLLFRAALEAVARTAGAVATGGEIPPVPAYADVQALSSPGTAAAPPPPGSPAAPR